MKANFIRKPTPEEIYPQSEFIIEKAVNISKEEFLDLIRNPTKDRDYIASNINKMNIDEEGYVHCIYVVSDSFDYGILINSEGASYPRYTAYLPKELFKI